MSESSAIPINQIKAGAFYSEPVFLDSSYILLVPETPVPATLVNHLADWSFRTVLSSGTIFNPNVPHKEAAGTIEDLVDEDRKSVV
mgnify:FL=1